MTYGRRIDVSGSEPDSTGSATRRATPDESRPQRFTGWRIVTTGAVLWALQGMIWVQGYGNLAVELRSRFGWSKTFFSLAFAATRTEAALIGPAQGNALARFGARRVMRLGAVVVAIGFVALSQVDTRFEFVVAMTFTTLGVAATGFLTLSAATVQWFERKRARALSIQTMGFAIGGFAGPIVVVGYRWFGWRPTVAASGLVIAVVAWFIAPLIGRTPADTGELVDGEEAPPRNTPRAEGVRDEHFSAPEAMRTRAFWMISGGHGAALLVVSASMAHLTLYLTEDRGFSPSSAALVAGIVPLFQFVGTGLGGYLGDRVRKRLVAGAAMLAHGGALLLLTWVDHWTAIGAFVVLHGLAWGARGPLMNAIRADYFGSTSFGSIMGWSRIIVTIGAIGGPIVAGVLADATGDYRLGFTILGVGAAAGVGFWIAATPPGDPGSAERDRSATGQRVDDGSETVGVAHHDVTDTE